MTARQVDVAAITDVEDIKVGMMLDLDKAREQVRQRGCACGSGNCTAAGIDSNGTIVTIQSAVDVADWVVIEVSSGDIKSEEKATTVFNDLFAGPSEATGANCFLLQVKSGEQGSSDAGRAEGERVATASLWHTDCISHPVFGSTELAVTTEMPTLHYVAVKSAHQGKGYGKRVVCHVVTEACCRGRKRLLLTSQTTSARALMMYKRCFGFVPLIRRTEEGDYDRSAWRTVEKITKLPFLDGTELMI
eukprot:m.363746 g.363746  ORF g.363746 m.363746 type:complete len:247 (+) comp23915_c0_seq1:152-892(+)